MEALTVDHLSITFPSSDGAPPLDVLTDISFGLEAQEFVAVLGPSGSGKSTLLRVLAGLLPPTAGSAEFCSDLPIRVGLVFQQANLMPWRTVLENITLPLELQGVPVEAACARAREWVAQVGLQGFEDAWPRDLSGGMAQRVALARALIADPDLLLLDEPFGALDALTRERMGAELLALWQARRKTVLLVTHSISEALLLSDRVLVLTQRPGRICLDLSVPFPRPRTEELRYTPEFGALSRRLRAAIGN
ncbi:MAG TPA: ABC transporter ATP-binding protein [Anaerolineaceae bacterium]|nr:ABC transporter ATP-binding protein [Anaerolineaceae bacterium]HOG80613.1 ABC transporter ATP-binding protein [Anaerolineaceae bacterium]